MELSLSSWYPSWKTQFTGPSTGKQGPLTLISWYPITATVDGFAKRMSSAACLKISGSSTISLYDTPFLCVEVASTQKGAMIGGMSSFSSQVSKYSRKSWSNTMYPFGLMVRYIGEDKQSSHTGPSVVPLPGGSIPFVARVSHNAEKTFGKQLVAFAVSGLKGTPDNPFAYMKKDHHSLKYAQEDLNIGAGFDMNTGIFTAPVDGIYYFSWYGCDKEYSSDFHYMVWIKHEGHPDAQMQGINMPFLHGDTGSIATISTKGYVYMKKGDVVSTEIYGSLFYSVENPGGFKDFPEYVGFSDFRCKNCSIRRTMLQNDSQPIKIDAATYLLGKD
ncbi:unnamed protein product [Notodromas monacha]|uniref:C1q domain-containing protein n=1 Tax=Notodromas monacha TaxID=399045 RepID=A0A7R9BV44_9CRUS|nr:unnamed protein product [Notodromas monacha]CAG0920953.1 unnamed protein product [Notodromas monacha]